MDLSSTLIAVADAYGAARKIARPTVSGLMLKDSRALDRVASGGSITIRNYERCLGWLSEHWPADVAWPKDIKRPTPAATGREAGRSSHPAVPAHEAA